MSWAGWSAVQTRVGPGTLRLGLIGEFHQLPLLVALAQREKSCSAFFDFSLEIEAVAVSLVVQVPEEASTILDNFASPTRQA